MKIFTSRAIVIIAIPFIFAACTNKQEPDSHSPFHAKISAFTSGQISARAPIMIEFSAPVDKAVPGQKANENLISISPSVKGEAAWAGNRTLIFKPFENLPSGRKFKVEVDLPKLLPNEQASFFFTFRTVPQNAWLNTENIGPVSVSEYDQYKVSSRITLADAGEDKLVEQNVEVTYNGKTLPPDWTHLDSRNHVLVLNNLNRNTSPGQLEVTVKKGPLSPDEKQSLTIEIPAKGAFEIISAKMESTPRKVVTITFSDPLDPAQDLSGLFRLADSDPEWNIDNNRAELYPAESLNGEQELTISPDVKNIAGKKLAATGEFIFTFSSEKPAVELIGNGVIMPYSEGLYLPFKAVSLNTVRIRIIKIYEHNIGHFLQINLLSGESQLKRAGRLVHKQRIEIDNDPTLNLDKWNTFSLDLSKFVQPDPGAIYRVELGFEKQDAIYPCAGDNTAETAGSTTRDDPDEDFWDSTDSYYSTYPNHYGSNYNWRHRDDPCMPSYYTRDRWVSRNVLASNLGLMVKGGTNNQLRVTVTDLRTTEPLNGIEVEIFNLQMVKIEEGKTDKNGQAYLSPEDQPFLLVAKQNKQRGYLRLDEGQALPLDRFDVSGETVREGLRGFIFGERGVWRPGDSLFVSFLPMESDRGTLPPNYPVTFELTDPRGRLIHRQTQTHPENKIYTFRTKTPEGAPTGFWLTRISMGGVVFEKALRIETIRPNRLKVTLDVADDLLKSNTTSSFDIQSSWLHGSPASELKADVRMTVRPAKTAFEGFHGYHFDDPTRNLDESELTIYEGILDKEGHASFRKELPSFNRAPGMLRGAFSTRVFEEGGAFSTGTSSSAISPYNVYTGIKTPEGDDRGLLLTDKDYKIDLVTVNENGEPAGSQTLQYTIYKISWRWWWEKSKDDLGRYISSSSRNIIHSGQVTTDRNGKAQFNFRIDKPNWGRYLIRVVNSGSGHATATTLQVDWPGWARESRGGDGASQLMFATGKSTYKVGEEISVTFPSSTEGRALVSLETGSTMLKSWWIKPDAKETAFTFKATPQMTPNIYISVTLIQPYQQSANNRPIRLYGIVPVMIEDPATRLTPKIKTTDTWRPGKKAVIEVSETNNEAMDYVVAVVDEGLLDLTNHATPDPWSRFNARQALGVKTWDLYNDVIGAFGGNIEQLFSVGGDGELSGDKSKNQLRRFEPMVRFIGPFSLKKRGSNKHTLDIPSYNGSVRAMVIATNGRATGSNHTTVKVRNPIMVWASLPKVMGPEEKLSLPVTVFVTEENITKVTVTLEGTDHYTTTGNNTQIVSFDGPGEQNVYFDIATNKLTGSSQLTITAKGNGEQSVLKTNLEVRMPNPPVTQTIFSLLKGKSSDNLNFTLPGIRGTNTTQLEVSIIPPMDLTERLSYLLNYPHGCIEQITSGGFPQLYIDKVVDLNDVQKSKMRDNIASVLQRYSSYQTSDGGFAYWPGPSQTSDWGTSYAGHFMAEAEKQGYMVRPSIKSQWLKSQKSRAKSWLPQPGTDRYTSEQMLQAYRLYTLALAGEPATGAMNRLRQQSELIVQARWLLASAYALSGMNEVAEGLMNAAADASSTKVQNRTYGSSLRDKAILINALNLLNRKEQAMPLVRQAAEKLSNDQWYSTQTTAWTLMSIVNFAGDNTDNNALQYTYTVNSTNPVTVGTDKPISQTVIKTGSAGKGSISVTNNTNNDLFTTLVMHGIPAGIDTVTMSENLKLETHFLTMHDQPVSTSEIKQGTDFKYVIKVRNPGTAGDADNLALTQMVPSGWEIRNTRMEGSVTHERDLPDYRDIRDDRVLSYFNLDAGHSKEFVVVVHAAFAGEFYLPPIICEAMYNHAIRARLPGKKTKVINP
jgi:uncharacterized protein YfaS (alpha-2-macroglobulin family)